MLKLYIVADDDHAYTLCDHCRFKMKLEPLSYVAGPTLAACSSCGVGPHR